MFSEIPPDEKNNYKKNTLDSLDYEKNRSISNIDELVDGLLNKSRRFSPKKVKIQRNYNIIFRRLSFKKTISVALSLILLFAVIASASSLIDPEIDNTSTDFAATDDGSIVFSNTTSSETNITDVIFDIDTLLPVDENLENESDSGALDESSTDQNTSINETQNETSDGLLNESLNEAIPPDINDLNESTNETIPPVDDVNESINETVPPVDGNESANETVPPDDGEPEPLPDDEEPPPDVEPDIDGTPYNTYETPENSLGASTVKVVNMTYFWDYFNRYSGWYLDAWDPTSVNWVDVSQYLNVISDRSEDNQFEKVSLEFNAPITADYRLTYEINKPLKSYVNRSDQNIYELIYPIGDNDEYSTYFDFSDIASLPDVIINHGVENINGDDAFWFSVQKNNVTQGTFVSLDPIFGNQNIGGFKYGAEDCPGGYFQMGSLGGTADNISAYLDYVEIATVKCAIYHSSGNLLTNGITNEETITADGWYTFSFSTGPLLTADTWYYLVVFASGTKTNLYYDTSGGDGFFEDTGETYPTFPDPYAATPVDNDGLASIYCTYTEFGLPSVVTNASSGVEETNATLNGYLTSNGGSETQTWLILNNTNDFGVPLINISKGVTASQTEFSNDTAGETALTQGTIYYYKAGANSSVGWGEGAVESFLTKPDPLSGFSATVVGGSQIDLSWSDGVGGDGAYVEFAVGSAPSPWNVGDGSLVDADGNVTTPFSHNSLTPGTHYYYKAWAFASDGGWTSSGNLSAPRGDGPQTADGVVPALPVVVTNESTGVEETNATLNGYLQSNGSVDTTCYFLWGTQNPPTDNNVTQGIVANNTEFSYDTSGTGLLTRGTLYYFDTKASNSGGWDDSGGVKTFLTKPDPPTGFNAQANSSSMIYLDWTLGTGANRTFIERNSVSNWAMGEGIEVYNDTGIDYENSGLIAGTTYYYQAWSYTSWTYDSTTLYQWSDANASANAETPSGPPTVVTNESTGVEETNATLHGYLQLNGSADTICYFLLNDTSDFGSPIFNLSKGIIANNAEFENDTADETTLNPGTRYYYMAQANNSGGWVNGEVQSFLTKPDPLSGFSATVVGGSQIDLSWSDGVGGDGAYVEFAVGSAPSPWNVGDGSLVDADGNVTTPFSHNSLTPGTHYYYKAWAFASDGGWTSSGNLSAPRGDSPQTVDATTLGTIPVVTTNVSTGVEETNATLWGYLSSNGSADTQTWFVLNNTNDFGSPLINISMGVTANLTEFSNDTAGELALSKGTLYYFKTQANNSGGWGEGAVESFLTKPDPLSGFSATVVGGSQIDLSWSDGVGGDGAYVEYATGSAPSPWNEGDGSPVDAEGNVTTPFSHTSLTPGTHYYYKAWAFASDGGWTSSGNQSAPRGDGPQTADGIVPALPIVVTNESTGVEETNATLNGYLQSNGSVDTTCFFLWGVQNPPTDNNVTQGIIANNTEFSYDTSGTGLLTRGTLYYFDTKASNSGGWDDSGGVKTFLTKPDPPSSLVAQANDSSVIYLTWNTGTGFNTTYIERNASGETVWARGAGTMIYNGTGTNCEDTGLTEGVTYYYQAWSFANWTYDSTTLYQWSDNNASDNNKTNDIPTIADEVPANESTGISPIPQTSITVNDADGDSMTITWRSNATQSGLWEVFGTNVTGTDGNGTYYQTNSNFSNFSKTYYWNISVSDGKDTNDSEIFWFSTELLTTSVDPISPYETIVTPLAISATGSSGLDNVTLWYRYSSDNLSWIVPPNWWDNSFTYRKNHTIVNAAGAGTNYQVKIIVENGTGTSSGDKVYINNKAQKDFDDIRFVSYSDNTTELYYWIEEVNPDVNATFWVEIQDDLSTTNSIIWIYYGNNTIVNNSNGSNTFIFFDDFSGDLSKWTRHTTSGVYPQIENGYLRCGGGSTGAPYGHTVCDSDATYTGFQNGAIDYKYLLASNAISELGFRGIYGSNQGYKARSDQRSGEGQSFLDPPYSGWGFTCGADGNSPSASIWYGCSIRVIGSNFYFYRNDNLVTSCSDSTYSAAGSISCQNHYGSYSDFDDVRVRKYVSPEPSHGAWSNEEVYYGGQGINWTEWSNPSNPDIASPWSWDFDFPNETGYYEFYSIGKKLGSVNETSPSSADAKCFFNPDTSINVTPDQWNIGTTTIGSYNYSTSNDYFNLTNEGDVALDIQIKASNATNATTGAQWELSSTPAFDNYSLKYNRSGDVSWTNINLTYDTFVTNLATSSWQTFDLNVFMATSSTKGEPLSITVTFRSVAS